MNKKRKIKLVGYNKLTKICLIMRLSVFFMFAFIMNITANTVAQKTMTLTARQMTFKEIFLELKKQTGYTVVYNNQRLNVDRQLNVEFKDASVKDVLDKILVGSGLTYEMMDDFIILSSIAQRQKVGVRIVGKVTDEKNYPLPGVTIIVKGLTLGTVTDKDGKYALTLMKTEKLSLLFSFIGMETQEVKYVGKDTINVTMKESAEQLEEVIVNTGYQRIDARTTTSAITSIKADDIRVPGITTIDKMLEGHVPGMIFMQNSGQVGATPQLRIRGTSTVLGNQEPLWVVDGIVQQDPVNVDPQQLNDLDFVNLLGNAISGLNPEDIEQIDVLKDASATAIYGARAANGVIVITTKKGKQGPPSVSYSFAGTYARRPRYSDRSVDMMNSQERVELSRELIERGMTYPNISSWVGYEKAIRDYYNREISFSEMKKEINRYETVNTDWFDLLTRDALTHQHTLNLSGGSSQLNYYVSVGYTNAQGNINGELNRNYTTSANISASYDRFSVHFKLNGSVEKRKYKPSDIAPMTYAYQTSRAVPVYSEDGNLWYYYRTGYENDQITFNILEEIASSFYDINTNRMSFSTSVDYRVTSNLSLSTTLAYNFSNNYQDTYYNEKSYRVRALRKDYILTSINGGESAWKQATGIPFGGELTDEYQRNNSYTVRLQANYNKSLDQDDKHVISAAVGGELSSSRYVGKKQMYRGYLPERGKQMAQVDLAEYQTLKNWYRDDPLAAGVNTDNLTNMISGYATASYTYNRNYTFNANMRMDASNAFGDKSNDKILPIWSVSGYWNIKNSVFSNQKFLTELSLRSSFGYQGNMLSSESPEMILKRGALNPQFDEYTSSIVSFANPFLKWEKTQSVNFSLDFGFLKNRINGSVSYFYKKTRNAFLSKTVSEINGVDSYTVNQGTITNQGVELSLRVTPVSSVSKGNPDGFRWTFDPQLGRIVNTLIDKALKRKDKTLHDEYTYNDYLKGNVQVPGRSLNSFWSYRFKGLDETDGRPMFYGAEETCLVDGEDKKTLDVYNAMSKDDVFLAVMDYSGRRVPTLQGGLNNTFSFKRMVLSLNLAYSLGSKIRLLNLYNDVARRNASIAPQPLANVRREFLKRWQYPGDENYTNIPGIISGQEFTATLNPWWKGKPCEFAENIWQMYNDADIRVVSGNYLKLQHLSFRYSLPEKFCEKLYLKSAYFGFAVTNLFTICNKKLKGQAPTQFGGSSSNINMSERPTFSMNFSVSF